MTDSNRDLTNNNQRVVDRREATTVFQPPNTDNASTPDNPAEPPPPEDIETVVQDVMERSENEDEDLDDRYDEDEDEEHLEAEKLAGIVHENVENSIESLAIGYSPNNTPDSPTHFRIPQHDSNFAESVLLSDNRTALSVSQLDKRIAFLQEYSKINLRLLDKCPVYRQHTSPFRKKGLLLAEKKMLEDKLNASSQSQPVNPSGTNGNQQQPTNANQPQSNNPSGPNANQQQPTNAIQPQSNNPSGTNANQQQLTNAIQPQSNNPSGTNANQQQLTNAIQQQSNNPSGTNANQQQPTNAIQPQSNNPSGTNANQQQLTNAIQQQSNNPSGTNANQQQPTNHPGLEGLRELDSLLQGHICLPVTNTNQQQATIPINEQPANQSYTNANPQHATNILPSITAIKSSISRHQQDIEFMIFAKECSKRLRAADKERYERTVRETRDAIMERETDNTKVFHSLKKYKITNAKPDPLIDFRIEAMTKFYQLASLYRVEIDEPTTQKFEKEGFYFIEDDVKRFGERNFSKSTKKNYNCHLNMFWNFCCIVGDYDSLFMLLPEPPKCCPSVSPRTVYQFVLFRFNTFGTFVTKSFGSKTPIKDTEGKIMLAEGSCTAMGSTLSITSALSHLHVCHRSQNNHSKFTECCPKCRANLVRDSKLPEAKQSPLSKLKCDRPHDVYQFYQTGNAFSNSDRKGEDPIIQSLRSHCRDLYQQRNQVERRRLPFQPNDIRSILDWAERNKFSRYHLQISCMLLLCLRAGCRMDGLFRAELGNLNNFVQNGVMYKNAIQQIGQMVREKCDTQEYTYSIPFCDSHPLFCYVRSLLVFLHCFHSPPEGYFDSPPHWCSSEDNWRESFEYQSILEEWNQRRLFWFPRQEIFSDLDLVVRRSDPQLVRVIKQDVKRALEVKMRSKANKMMTDVLQDHMKGRTGKYKCYGMQSGRRSLYLFGILGKGNYEELRRNARHRSEQQGSKYDHDAATYLQRYTESYSAEVRENLDVPKFVSTCYQSSADSAFRISEDEGSSPPSNLRIDEIASSFVQDMLDVSPSDPNYRNPHYLLKLTRKKKFMRKSIEADSLPSKEKYLARLNLTPSQLADLEKYVTCIKEEHSAELWQSFQHHSRAMNPHLRLVYGSSPSVSSSSNTRSNGTTNEDGSHRSATTNDTHVSASTETSTNSHNATLNHTPNNTRNETVSVTNPGNTSLGGSVTYSPDLLHKVQMDNQDLLHSADTMFIEPHQLKILSYSPSESLKKKRYPQFELSEAFHGLSKILPPRSIYVAQRLVWEAYSIFHYDFDHELYQKNIGRALGYPKNAPESRPYCPPFTTPVDLPTSRNGHLVAPNANLHRHIHNIRRYHKCIDAFRCCLYYCCGGSPFNFFQRHPHFQIRPQKSKTGVFKCYACEMRETEKSKPKRPLDHSTK